MGAARQSAVYALMFIALLYTTAPAVSAFARMNLIDSIQDQTYSSSPSWFKNCEEIGLIDWKDKAANIIGKINGLYPYPGGYFILNGERFKILKAQMSYNKDQPGKVLSNDLEISCGENSIKILEIQREGKKPQKINEFVLGYSQIQKGTNLLNV